MGAVRTRHEVIGVRSRYFCDHCGDGELFHTGEVLTVYPPLYPHRCDNCGKDSSLDRPYPYEHFELVDPHPKQ